MGGGSGSLSVGVVSAPGQVPLSKLYVGTWIYCSSSRMFWSMNTLN